MDMSALITYQTVKAIEDKAELAIVKASVQLADQFKPDTDLAGRWTLERARQEIPDLWIPNCRRFVTLGIFRRTGGSRGGKRGYYQLVDIDAVKKALVDRGV
jgi:hypothetical protein